MLAQNCAHAIITNTAMCNKHLTAAGPGPADQTARSRARSGWRRSWCGGGRRSPAAALGACAASGRAVGKAGAIRGLQPAVAAESSSAGAWSSGVAPKEAVRGDRGAQCRRCALHALIWSHGCVPLLPDRPGAGWEAAGRGQVPRQLIAACSGRCEVGGQCNGATACQLHFETSTSPTGASSVSRTVI